MLSLGKHVVRCLETVINEPEWKIPKTPTKSSWRNFKSFRFWILFVISVTTLTITPIASYNIWLSKGLSGLISFVTGIDGSIAELRVQFEPAVKAQTFTRVPVKEAEETTQEVEKAEV